MLNTPILYSSNNCPFCQRARMALKYSKQKVILRNVELSQLPPEALAVSSHATVPSLVISDEEFFDESWDIAKWALKQHDPENFLGKENEYLNETEMLVEINDHSFKDDLYYYKSTDNEAEHPREYYRQRGEEFIEELNEMLEENKFLLSEYMSVADIAIFPFVYMFAMVDKPWFDKMPYGKLHAWFNFMLNSEYFKSVMHEHEIWQVGSEDIYL